MLSHHGPPPPKKNKKGSVLWMIIVVYVGEDLDEALTTFVNRMVPDGTWINTDSLIKAVESFILCQPSISSPTSHQQSATIGVSPSSTITLVHRLGESIDGISDESELEQLRIENREKTKRIDKLEAREHRFTHQIDKLDGDLHCLKAQFERYCANMAISDTSSATTNPGHSHNSERQTNQMRVESGSSGTTSTADRTEGTSPGMPQTIVQHFNTLGIDLRKFYNQMEVGDAVLKREGGV